MKISRPWLKSATFDTSFILVPALVSVLIVLWFQGSFEGSSGVPLWAWLLLVLGIDVSHVYSTLFRTYLNSNELKENKSLLILIPIGVWMIGVMLYSMGAMVFWRALAYVAVFHFIRQQYGFLRLYARQDIQTKFERWMDALVIYGATLYPMIYWHSHQPRNFHWFIDGDFFVGLPQEFSMIAGWIYLAILVGYVGTEARRLIQGHSLNLPKNILVLGTVSSWYVGIVHLNGDMAFTLTNIVSHGIPYMALVWLYGERQKNRSDAPAILGRFSYKMFFSKFSVPLFLGTLLLFAYLEEGLWAGLVWREHLEAFSFMGRMPAIETKDTLSLLVPLLALPQAVHYVLDGFIWKLRDSDANWQKVIFRS